MSKSAQLVPFEVRDDSAVLSTRLFW